MHCFLTFAYKNPGSQIVEIDRNLIMSLLKLTRYGLVPTILVTKEANLPVSYAGDLISKLQTDGLVYLKGDSLKTTSSQRAHLAILSIEQGADPWSVSVLLNWQEFEHISFIAFVREGYTTVRNLRFKQNGRKWEIDVVGCRRSLVVCADCKHWRVGLCPSVLKKMTSEQIARVSALLHAKDIMSEKLGVREGEFTIVPIVLSLMPSSMEYFGGVPIVPVLKLHAFLDELPMHATSLFHFSAENFKSIREKTRNLDEFM